MLAPGGWGEKSLREYSYSMVMEVDGRVELSGQGGWDPETLEFPTGRSIEEEINQASDNVAAMLSAVGLGWENVAHVNSYHVPEADGTILARLRRLPANSAGECLTINPYGHVSASRSLAIQRCGSKSA